MGSNNFLKKKNRKMLVLISLTLLIATTYAQSTTSTAAAATTTTSTIASGATTSSFVESTTDSTSSSGVESTTTSAVTTTTAAATTTTTAAAVTTASTSTASPTTTTVVIVDPTATSSVAQPTTTTTRAICPDGETLAEICSEEDPACATAVCATVKDQSTLKCVLDPCNECKPSFLNEAGVPVDCDVHGQPLALGDNTIAVRTNEPSLFYHTFDDATENFRVEFTPTVKTEFLARKNGYPDQRTFIWSSLEHDLDGNPQGSGMDPSAFVWQDDTGALISWTSTGRWYFSAINLDTKNGTATVKVSKIAFVSSAGTLSASCAMLLALFALLL